MAAYAARRLHQQAPPRLVQTKLTRPPPFQLEVTPPPPRMPKDAAYYELLVPSRPRKSATRLFNHYSGTCRNQERKIGCRFGANLSFVI